MKNRRIMKLVSITTIVGILLAGCGSGAGTDVTGNSTEHTGDVIEESSQVATELEDAAEQFELSTESDETDEAKTTEVADAEASDEEEQIVISEITSDGKINDYESVVVLDGAGYEMYTYTDSGAQNYTTAVNTFADELAGVADVYDLIIPLSSGITFPDNRRKDISSSDQEKANADIMGMLDENVKKVDIFTTMMQHRDEYIYFRTDHHWTALGAYYAYTQFCKAKGIVPEDISTYETKEYDGFLGSFYNDTKDESLYENPDVLEAYVPNCKATMHVEPSKGDAYDWNIIGDVSGYKPGLKYSTFIAGDNPYSVITNKDITDGSSCILVKESFGNAFAPFLVDHYQYIYVVDYRYWTGNLKELAEEKEVDDVIFVNNLSMIRNKYLVGQLRKIID